MRLGLNLGYWGADAVRVVDVARHAESLGFHSVWTAEAYGSDAITGVVNVSLTPQMTGGKIDLQATGSNYGDDHALSASLTYGHGFAGNKGPQFAKDPPLDLYDLLLRIEHLALVFFELRRGETFGVDQGLLAVIIGGRVMQVGLRDLNVIPENRIELDLQ